jgi:hypothetical protein
VAPLHHRQVTTELDPLHRYRPVLLGDSGDRFTADGVAMFAGVCGDWIEYWTGYSGDRDHAGTDWELALVHLPEGATVPLCAVYASHRGAAMRPWANVPKEGDRPIVYVSRDKHSSRFRRGWHRHGRHLERCNGRDRLDASFTIGIPVVLQTRLAFRDPDRWVAAKT